MDGSLVGLLVMDLCTYGMGSLWRDSRGPSQLAVGQGPVVGSGGKQACDRDRARLFFGIQASTLLMPIRAGKTVAKDEIFSKNLWKSFREGR